MKKLLLILVLLCSYVFNADAQMIQSGGLVYYDTTSAGPVQQAANPGPPSPQDGSGFLGQIYNNSACGLNYVQASVMITTRYSPPGVGLPLNLNISGIPCNSVIEQAYVWWTTSGAVSSGSVTITNPASATSTYAATLIGSGPDKCWATAATYSFRANVTAAISGNGNYNLNITTGAYDTDGATLFIIYRDLSATYQGSLVINDGCVVNNTGGSVSQTMTGFSACAGSTTANAFAIASDLQNNVAATHTTTLNGSPLSFSQNFWNFDVANTSVFAGQSSATYGISTSSDCYAFAVMGLYYQTTTCVTCTPSSAMTVASSQTNVTCSGGSNGSATVSPSGGTAPYSYSWSPFGGTSATASGLPAGTYTCTITDASGCATTQTVVTITQPSAVTASQSQTNVSCPGGNNGSATVSASGGNPGYTYSWSPSGGSGPTATGLAAGSYTCTITDANGCSIAQSFNISQPAALSASMSSTNASCSAPGSATVSPSGGTPGYTYSWSPSGGNGATATGLSAGSYTCTITDANGCSTTSSVTITGSTGTMSVTGGQTNVSCFGGNNGSATVSVSGGNPGYSYSWSPTGGNGATATGLTAGTYTCTITDAGGCVTTQVFTISESTAISPNAAVVNATCGNTCDGALSAQISGGSGSYTYLWQPGNQTTALITNQCAGTYTLNITDGNGCTAANTFNITAPPAINASIGSVVQPTCTSAGSATVTASGGTGSLAYSWSPSGGNAATATGLSAGNYTVTVTDANNCSTTASVTITAAPSALSVQNTQANVSCSGGSDGTATVSVSGGTPGYTYSWSPSGGNAATATGLAAGTYTCTITDAGGCTSTAVFTVTEPAPLTVIVTVTDATCASVCDGTASVQPSGGNGPWTFVWSPSGQTTQTITSLCPGIYVCTITDANGCTVTIADTVNVPPALTASTSFITAVSCSGGSDGAASVTASGGSGSYSYSWSPVGGTGSSASGLGGGSYTVTVNDAAGCATTVSLTIPEPAAIALNVTGNTAICTGDSTLITANVTGGTAPYTYSWSNGNTNASQYVSPATDTTYSVTVTDANGCTVQQQSITVNVSPPLVCTISTGDTICAGDSVAVFVTAAGGNGNYTYTWTNGLGSGPGPYMVAPGTTTAYSCTVSDGCGTSFTGIVNVVVVPSPVATFTAAPDSGSTGEPVIFIDSSPNSSSWQWYFGDGDSSNVQNPVHVYNDAGEFTVTLIASNSYGCTDTIQYNFIHILEGLSIPNVFSPNGDGVNDVFHIKASGVEEYTIEIFNRWGMKMFETTAPRIDWDGRTNSGQFASPGTYYFILYATTTSGKVYDVKGHITLLR